MKTNSIVSRAGFGLLVTTVLLHAGKDSPLKPALPVPGRPASTETFEGTTLARPWTVAKGGWKPVAGELVGQELKSDEHAAVLTLARPHQNSVVQFSFKLEGAQGFNLSYNHAKGHLFRVFINPDGVAVQKDLDKKNPKSRAEKLGEAKGAFAAGQWHTIQVATKDGDVLVTADNGINLRVSHAGLNTQKTGYRFVMRGETLRLDDVKVWSLD